jgi:hypothetical protein
MWEVLIIFLMRLNCIASVLPNTGTRLVPEYFCLIPEQIVLKEEQIVYRF